MTFFRKTARDITVVATSHLVMWLGTFVFTVAQAHYLGPARFGELSLALSYMVFFTTVVDFGLSLQLSRLVAQRSETLREAVAATLLLRVGLWIPTVLLAWLAATILGYDRELRDAILILALSVLIIAVSQTIGAYLQGRERFLPQSLASIAQRLAAAALGVIVLIVRPELGAIAEVFVVAALINVAVLLFAVRGASAAGIPHIDFGTTLQIFRGAVPIAMYGILMTFALSLDMAMLQRMAPPENVGWYAAAFRLFIVPTLIPTVVGGIVLFPVFSRLSLDSPEELRKVIEKAFTFLAVVGSLVALILALFPERILATVYPDAAYAPAANALRLLAPALLLIYLNAIFGYSLFGLHRERRLLIMAGAAAILTPLANLVAITALQQDGAALTRSLIELFFFVCLLWMMPRDLLSREILRVGVKSIVAAGVAGFVLMPWREHSLLLTLPLVLAVYVVAILALRTVAPADLAAVVTVIRPGHRSAHPTEVSPEAVVHGAVREEAG